MRDYGKVFSRIWESTDFRSLSEDGRTLALYLLTCQHGTIAGVFRVPDGYASEDLQWDVERVAEGFRNLAAKGFATRCNDTKWVWLHKFLEWNPPENPNQRKAAAKVAMSVPDQCTWKSAFMRVSGDFLGIEVPAEPNPSETVSEPLPNQYQEQYQEQEQKQEEKKPPRKRSATPDLACPSDVAEQVWADWLTLRKKKSAPVTATVIEGAVEQAGLAGMTLEAFLRVWCRRGSQGLEASWLRPDERGQQAETTYQRTMRERMQEVAPDAARKDPAHAAHAADYFNAIDVPTRTVERIR